MVCYKCKKQIENDASICPFCGSPQKFEPFIKRAMRNDQAAFSQLYYMTKDHVYYSIKSMYGDENAIEDIMQLTFIDAFTKLETLSQPEAFRGWVKQISIHKTIDYLRKKDTRIFSEAASMDSDDLPELWDENPDHSPENVIDQKENTRIVKELLDSLPDEQRIVIGMYYYEEMTIPEIAKALNVSEGTVKSRRRYGQKKIEAKIAGMKNINLKLLGSTPASVLFALLRAESASAAETNDRRILHNVLREISKKEKAGLTGPVGRFTDPSKNVLQAGFKPGEVGVNAAVNRSGLFGVPKGGSVLFQAFAPRFLTGATIIALAFGSSAVFGTQIDWISEVKGQTAQSLEPEMNERAPEDNSNDQPDLEPPEQPEEELVQPSNDDQNDQEEREDTSQNPSNNRSSDSSPSSSSPSGSTPSDSNSGTTTQNSDQNGNPGGGDVAPGTQENEPADDEAKDEEEQKPVNNVTLNISRPTYGDALTALVEPEDAEVTYQWYTSENGDIEGATGQSYTPTADEVMKHVGVRVTGKNTFGGTVAALTDAPVQRVYVADLVTLDIPRPTYGDTITAVVNSDSDNITYQWYNTDGIIEGATGKSYTPTANDISKHLHVYVIDDIIHTGDIRTAAPVQRAPLSSVTLDIPRPTYGDTITALVEPEDANVTYQWYNSDGKIEGATKQSYTPTENDIMKQLRVYAYGADPYTGTVTVRTAAPVQRP